MSDRYMCTENRKETSVETEIIRYEHLVYFDDSHVISRTKIQTY